MAGTPRPDGRRYLPAPYNARLSPDDLARYGDVLDAREHAALRLRLAGLSYPQIAAQLGITEHRARELARQACWRVSGAKHQREHQH